MAARVQTAQARIEELERERDDAIRAACAWGDRVDEQQGSTFEREVLYTGRKLREQQATIIHELEQALQCLRAWDMVHEPAPGNAEPCSDAPWARKLIDAALAKEKSDD